MSPVGQPDGQPRPEDRIYCCRGLRLDQVNVVGFDLDYTLARYEQHEMEPISVAATLRRLVQHGYPASLADISCPRDFAIRGLLIDVHRGNVLKMDRYRYVKVAYHGLRRLSRDERRDLYEARSRVGKEPFRWIDTLYGLADVAVYAAVVDALERAGRPLDHRRLYEDVRAAADAAHGAGEIYAHVLGDFDRYVRRDPALAGALHRLRSAGKRLFLLTNAAADTCAEMMGRLLDGSLPGYRSWQQYFDVVVADARKPAFFVGDRPFVDVERPGRAVTELRRGHLYEGGNLRDFERMLGVGGNAVLYVGDHIYGDVLRANVGNGWRTLMIIQELADGFAAEQTEATALARLDGLDLDVRLLQDHLRALPPRTRATERVGERLRRLESERDALEREIDAAFHPFWGSLFKAGSELSSFGAQVEQHAWLYTDRVSNLGGYSPAHFFRSPRARMPHEL